MGTVKSKLGQGAAGIATGHEDELLHLQWELR
jgi:hypothetical protein